MAKRFTDTDKWKDDWFISLSNDYKIIWQWLLDNCSHSGLCKRSTGLMNMMCRSSVTEMEMINAMEGRVLIVEDYWFIPKFIRFQYSTLQSGKPAIVSVVKDLFKYKLVGMIPESFGNDYKIMSESFDNHSRMIKDMVKDKDKVKDSKVKKEGENLENQNPMIDGDGKRIYYSIKTMFNENKAAFDSLGISTRKMPEFLKSAIEDYHLYLTEQDKYPMTKESLVAGVQRRITNGWTPNNITTQQTGNIKPSSFV